MKTVEIALLLRTTDVYELWISLDYCALGYSRSEICFTGFLGDIATAPVAEFGGEEMLSSPSTVTKKETSVVASVLPDQKKTTAIIDVVNSNGLLVGQDGFSPDLIVLLPDLRGDLQLWGRRLPLVV
ncbi:hypothetical protein ACLOJK_004012 [Asimina triloba]